MGEGCCWKLHQTRQGCRESHFEVPHPNPEVSVGESIEVHAWLRAEWVMEMNAVCKMRENWGGEVWSCLYTQMRLLQTRWLEIGHDQFKHLGRGGGIYEICCGGIFKSNFVFFCVPLQNTKAIIMDPEVTMTSSPMALHPRRLSLQLSPPTS